MSWEALNAVKDHKVLDDPVYLSGSTKHHTVTNFHDVGWWVFGDFKHPSGEAFLNRQGNQWNSIKKNYKIG